MILVRGSIWDSVLVENRTFEVKGEETFGMDDGAVMIWIWLIRILCFNLYIFMPTSLGLP